MRHHCLGHTDMASETEALLTSPGRAVARHRAMVAIVVAVLCATAFALVASAGGESAARAFARLGVSGARVRSSHVDGRTPTVFVAETEDPSREDWFEPLKATILATADLPELIGRLEPVESVRATDLPTRIELYEEAAQNLKDGFASLVGEYVGRRHAYADADVHPLFTLDEGKKMIVRRDVVDAHPRLGAFLADVRKADASASLGADGSDAGSKPATESSVGAEISESEKAVLGAKIGASVAHLLAWTRATSRVDSSAWVLGSTTRLLGLRPRRRARSSPANSSCRCSTRCPRTGRTTRTWCSWISSDARRTRKRRGRGDGSTHEAGRVVERRRIRPGREPRRRRRPRGVLSHNATVHGESAADDRRGRVRVRGRVARGEVRTGEAAVLSDDAGVWRLGGESNRERRRGDGIDRPTVEETRVRDTRRRYGDARVFRTPPRYSRTLRSRAECGFLL